jgi:hypothetical protein
VSLSPTLQQDSHKRSVAQLELPARHQTVEQKQAHDQLLIGELARKFQDEDSASAKLIGPRTESENGIELAVIYLLIELRTTYTCLRQSLLEEIAATTAQLTPIHNHAKRFKVAIYLIGEDIPFYSFGSERHPAARDIVGKADFIVTGLVGPGAGQLDVLHIVYDVANGRPGPWYAASRNCYNTKCKYIFNPTPARPDGEGCYGGGGRC